jgi:hypothetical protein
MPRYVHQAILVRKTHVDPTVSSKVWETGCR